MTGKGGSNFPTPGFTSPGSATPSPSPSRSPSPAPGCRDPLCKTRNCAGGHAPTPPAIYAQANDPSVKPYLRAGDEVMGQTAFTKQLAGQPVKPEDVRVTATQGFDRRAGSGMHEFFPTDQHKRAVGNAELAAYQSGARSSTDHTLFNAGGGKVAAHTGAFPKATGGGSTHTSGQKAAHDLLRQFQPTGKTPMQRFVERAGHSVSGLATGQQVLEADNLTGALPNRLGAAPLEPATATAKPSRKRAADTQHDIREHAKRRINSAADYVGITRPCSPEREEPGGPLNGGYSNVQRATSPVPLITGSSRDVRNANFNAWLTGPLRPGFESQTSRYCCGRRHDNAVTNCVSCGKGL